MFSKLRHPVRALREPFGTAAIVIAAIALLAALGGVAVASGGLSSKVKNEIKKYAKLYSKQFAVPGAQGPAGPQGAPGANGKDGTNGVDGKSVVVSTASCGGLGGAEVKQEGAGSGVEVCNGEEGSPWTAGGTLPPGQSEKGAFRGTSTGLVFSPVSFNIPLAQSITELSHIKLVESSPVAACDDGNAADGAPSAANPEAAPGYFCIFNVGTSGAITGVTDPSDPSNATGVGRTGAIITMNALTWGTWAVTAPTP